jgi:hypothetical protein
MSDEAGICREKGHGEREAMCLEKAERRPNTDHPQSLRLPSIHLAIYVLPSSSVHAILIEFAIEIIARTEFSRESYLHE